MAMRAQKVASKGFDFYFPKQDLMILVEADQDDGVLIRATRDTFSEDQKACFIRELALEGFIPESYQFFSGSISEYQGIRWTIDYSWLEIPPDVIRRSNRFMRVTFAAIAIVWLLAMTTLVTNGPARAGTGPAKTIVKAAAPASGISRH
jgi:hypothetical protein